MPPTRDSKQNYSRSFSNSGMTMSARVYHPATNLMPPTPPHSPSGMSQSSFSRPSSTGNSWGRQDSQGGGKYS